MSSAELSRGSGEDARPGAPGIPREQHPRLGRILVTKCHEDEDVAATEERAHVRRCLEKRKEDRFQTAHIDVGQDVQMVCVSNNNFGPLDTGITNVASYCVNVAGTATQVDNVQLGRYVAAGTPVFSVMDDTHPWVDANPKETDITYLRPGQRVTVEVDTFPDHVFTGTVAAVSPGTGAQFSILPPQNASGNWVKVVQRVPVRVQLDRDPALNRLRAGMSANVSIDTGHRRTLTSLFGLAHAEEAPLQAQ